MRRRATARLLTNLAGVVALVFFAFPVYWMFATAASTSAAARPTC